MTAATAALIQPVTLAGLPLSSQFVMAPMTRERSPWGIPTPENAAYYRRRAENGIGLIITEGVLVDHPSAGHQSAVPRLTAGAAEAGWRHVTSEVHAAGGRIAAQLWHLGSEREPVDGLASWTPTTMTGRDFDTIISAYAESARVAVRAGFDAVEVHAAHGYLLDEFLWPVTNPSRAHRGFPAEVVRAIRAEIPSCMPLIVRFSQFKERDYSARIAETPGELATILEGLRSAGADVLHASQRRFWEPVFAGSDRNLAGWARHLTGLPSITVGSIGLTPDFVTSDRMRELLDRHAAGEYDAIALGRVLLGNPAWVTHAGAGQVDKIHAYHKTDEERYF
ncbi:12-oxophytodienoate reductase [Actinoplanes sp. LDG1-06]|uniref:12-oxophytodienoate reductase n=1 Tax=Paractinoplanes ovalisporus TaxID=2810368 RepID=A0ABS2AJN4_9ACTN|nr:12-oxophytodienoate reductase [Actinoplanes ovalisporus]MBM2620049.1 12-oxophytodienoate reductase [Actinoplanes ovalisporus]